MKVIDFDAPMRVALYAWMHENADTFKGADDMEAHVGEVQMRFNNLRAEWLGGLSPIEYFAQFDDVDELVEGLYAYDEAGMDAPELLLERIVQFGEAAVEPLMKLMRDDGACSCLRVTALNLLSELNTTRPITYCLQLIDEAAGDDALSEVAAELLHNLGVAAVQPMLSRLDAATGPARMTYLDLLCNFPGDERIYSNTVRAFLLGGEHRALYASLLGRLGDPRAIEVLKRTLTMTDINYLDYLEIANAIEMLGGEAGERDRDFTGDPYYESLRQMG